MSEKLLKFLLSELDTVRLVCRHKGCDAIVELPMEALARSSFNAFVCPVCQNGIQPAGQNNLKALADAWKSLKSMNSFLDVEFVIPSKTGGTP